MIEKQLSREWETCNCYHHLHMQTDDFELSKCLTLSKKRKMCSVENRASMARLLVAFLNMSFVSGNSEAWKRGGRMVLGIESRMLAAIQPIIFMQWGRASQ